MVTHSQADGGLVFMWHVANSNTAAYTHTQCTHTTKPVLSSTGVLVAVANNTL